MTRLHPYCGTELPTPPIAGICEVGSGASISSGCNLISTRNEARSILGIRRPVSVQCTLGTLSRMPCSYRRVFRPNTLRVYDLLHCNGVCGEEPTAQLSVEWSGRWRVSIWPDLTDRCRSFYALNTLSSPSVHEEELRFPK